MRVFNKLNDAILEIRRDLTKAPIVPSFRVQSAIMEKPQLTNELVNYSYAVSSNGIPNSAQDLVAQYGKHFPWWIANGDELIAWAQIELSQRTIGGRYEVPADRLNPELMKYLNAEGNFDYAYPDRLGSHWVDRTVDLLLKFPTTRRCFVPIFWPTDTLYAAEPARIPCTIGYNWVIRDYGGSQPYLEGTIIQRSCDFDKYWLTDLWFTYKLTQHLLQEINARQPGADLRLGNIYHTIMSFHRFRDEQEEIF